MNREKQKDNLRFTMPCGRDSADREFDKWQRNNPYFKKQFSILGDSISTLDGYNPKGYKVFYSGDNCVKSDVSEMADAWWGQVIDFFGGELLVNNSWSGSRVTRLPNTDKLFPSGCSDERTNKLHINNVKPDVVIVYLGINDWAFGVIPKQRICTIMNGYIAIPEKLDESVFSYAYNSMIDKVRKNYPETEIWCCTLNTTYMSANTGFVFPNAYGGYHIELFNSVIRNTAAHYKCKLIDLYNYHTPYDTIDGTHPNNSGMNTLATLIIRNISDFRDENNLLCKDNQHEYIAVDKYTDGLKYECRKCGHIYNTSLFPDNNSGGESYNNSEYVDRFPNATKILYSETVGIDLFIERAKKSVIIKKPMFNAGGGEECELQINDFPKNIDKVHATFFFEKGNWYIRDNNSINGTYINGKRLEPGKKYLLYLNDEIDFAHCEKIYFFKSKSNLEQANCVNGNDKYVPLDLSGTTLKGKYKLCEILGTGGFSTVYLASVEGSDKKYAVKVIELGKISASTAKTMICAEVNIRKGLNHQSIQRVIDLIETQRYLFVVMEYIEGVTLNILVCEKGMLEPDLVINYTKQTASALQYLHSQSSPIIHCDVQPSNILITPSGLIKLIDFGAAIRAKLQYEFCKENDIEMYGVRGYASPEQYTGKADVRSDIFSLGMTMHRLVTGIDPTLPPYEARPICEINPSLPKGLEYIIGKCIELNPDNRYQSCTELLEDLDRYRELPRAKGFFAKLFHWKKIE